MFIRQGVGYNGGFKFCRHFEVVLCALLSKSGWIFVLNDGDPPIERISGD